MRLAHFVDAAAAVAADDDDKKGNVITKCNIHLMMTKAWYKQQRKGY